MVAGVNIRGDIRDLAKALTDLERRQLPFAMAQTVNGVAHAVQGAETKQLSQTFDTPTPFTLKAFAVKGATKASLTATVFAKDAQAAYLQPYDQGGLQVLGRKRGILTPIGVRLNKYGNIPRGQIAALKGKPGVFVGAVKFGGKTINGVWQRLPPAKGSRRGRRGAHVAKGPLKLLVEFTDPKAVTKRFPFETVAKTTAAKAIGPAWDTAITAALASAR